MDPNSRKQRLEKLKQKRNKKTHSGSFILSKVSSLKAMNTDLAKKLSNCQTELLNFQQQYHQIWQENVHLSLETRHYQKLLKDKTDELNDNFKLIERLEESVNGIQMMLAERKNNKTPKDKKQAQRIPINNNNPHKIVCSETENDVEVTKNIFNVNLKSKPSKKIQSNLNVLNEDFDVTTTVVCQDVNKADKELKQFNDKLDLNNVPPINSDKTYSDKSSDLLSMPIPSSNPNNEDKSTDNKKKLLQTDDNELNDHNVDNINSTLDEDCNSRNILTTACHDPVCNKLSESSKNKINIDTEALNTTTNDLKCITRRKKRSSRKSKGKKILDCGIENESLNFSNINIEISSVQKENMPKTQIINEFSDNRERTSFRFSADDFFSSENDEEIDDEVCINTLKDFKRRNASDPGKATESETLLPARRPKRSATQQRSYKEPSLNKKMRQ